MAVVTYGYYLLRRVSIVEFAKRKKYDPEAGEGSAALLDTYLVLLLIFWIVFPSCLRIFEAPIPRLASLWPLYVALQLLQAATWHSFFRHKLYPPNHVMRQAHDAFRNFVYALLGFCLLNILFAVAYAWSANVVCQELSWPNSIYFSFVTGATLGFGDVTPESGDWWMKSIVILQIVASLIMVSVILASAVTALETTKQELPPR